MGSLLGTRPWFLTMAAHGTETRVFPGAGPPALGGMGRGWAEDGPRLIPGRRDGPDKGRETCQCPAERTARKRWSRPPSLGVLCACLCGREHAVCMCISNFCLPVLGKILLLSSWVVDEWIVGKTTKMKHTQIVQCTIHPSFKGPLILL